MQPARPHSIDEPIIETTVIRDQALGLLDRLMMHRQRSEARLSEEGRSDPIKSITGNSAVECAIDTTRHLISEMDDLLTELSDGPPAHRLNGKGAIRTGKLVRVVAGS